MLPRPSVPENEHATHPISSCLREPTRSLINAIKESVKSAEATIQTIGGQRSLQDQVSLIKSLEQVRSTKDTIDSADALLVKHPGLPSSYHKFADVIELFLFVHPVHQTVDEMEMFVSKA